MAVAPSPNSKASESASIGKEKKRKMHSTSGEEVETKSAKKSANSGDKQPKRNKNPGVRVIHGRVYDSENGTTCHQCRQKTHAVYVNCKNQASAKPCLLKFCRTCLLNRYGEKVEDVASSDEWNCPKCRGCCNCSYCMKKRGHQPTGMLVQMAKQSGYSSVSDMLHVKGAGNVSNYKRVKETCDSPRKQNVPAEAECNVISSPKKLGKENLFDGNTDSNADPSRSIKSTVEEKPKKMKRKGPEVDGSVVNGVLVTESNDGLNEKTQKKLKAKALKKIVGGNMNTGSNGVQLKQTDIKAIIHNVTESNDGLNQKTQKKLKANGLKKIVGGNMNTGINGVQLKQTDIKAIIHNVNVDEKNIIIEDKKVLDVRCDQTDHHSMEDKKGYVVEKNVQNICNDSFEGIITLPKGSELVAIAGVDLPKEDAGNALQFLEFCTTFGKILDVKKGHAEAVLRDLIKGRSTRQGKYSLVIQFHIQLMSVIQEESGSEVESESESPTLRPTHGNNSWLKELKSYIPKAHPLLEHMDCIDGKTGGYDNLDSSTKLRLLIFLCDEVLGTEKFRNWIDDQNAEFAEKRKEAKDKLAAAKDKEKSLKQKRQDDIAKAIIAKEGAPLTLMEHDAIVSKIKNEITEAHAEMLACKGMLPIDNERPDAVRTVPIFNDNNGHVYWRLKGCSDKSDLLLQDVGTGDHTTELLDKWFHYDAQQMDIIEQHINALRSGFTRRYKTGGIQSA